MKNVTKSLLLVALLLGTALQAWSQSTEGKEFWVALTWAVTPPDPKQGMNASDSYYQVATPYIAISAQKKGTVVTLTNPAFPAWSLSYTTVQDNEWYEFKNIPNQYWYPDDMRTIADFTRYADEIRNWGIKVTASNNISVYSVVRANYSMDATNILPTTALNSEYYMQDFWPDYNTDGKIDGSIVNVNFNGPRISMATILATEDNTEIEIYPKDNTLGKNNKNTVVHLPQRLNKGQIYYLIGENHALMSGTRILAKDNKKIAVFLGDPITRLPAGISARDCLYEQAMPTVYWGTQFIVTRSLHKNANIIGITAYNDGTTISLNGNSSITSINEGETYYIVLQNSSDPWAKNLQKITDIIGTDHVGTIITGENDLYIETSCPAAVYNYDTGSSFKGDGTSEMVKNNEGDPSMVWVSPIQQKINKITFGTCTTLKTKQHFLNIITSTDTRDSTKLIGYYKVNNQIFPVTLTNNITWTTVSGNPTYSYARVQLVQEGVSIEDTYTLTNPQGFIATVYGNGDSESYAYSAGSAAIEYGVDVNNETFSDGYVSYTRFCVGSKLDFDAGVGSMEIKAVNWDFGDGITLRNASTQQPHEYTVPGWYDVRAELYGKRLCTDENTRLLDTIKFSIRVVRPDTIRYQSYDCVAEDYEGEMGRVDTAYYACDSVVITSFEYGRESHYEYKDTVLDGTYLNGKWYDTDGDYSWVIKNGNAAKCDSIITCHLRVLTCLQMTIPNNPEAQHICPGEDFLLQYTKHRGDIGEAHFICGQVDKIVTLSNNSIVLPTQDFKPGVYKARITVQDTICDRTLEFPIDLSVYYPKEIFKYKFNNVLAVYNKEYNGGYEFTGYQWYRNGLPIEGATSSVYHVDSTFTLGDIYFVVLTRADGVTLPCCPQTITNVPDYDEHTSSAPARKEIINQRMYIYIDDRIYDSHGQRIK